MLFFLFALLIILWIICVKTVIIVSLSLLPVNGSVSIKLFSLISFTIQFDLIKTDRYHIRLSSRFFTTELPLRGRRRKKPHKKNKINPLEIIHIRKVSLYIREGIQENPAFTAVIYGAVNAVLSAAAVPVEKKLSMEFEHMVFPCFTENKFNLVVYCITDVKIADIIRAFFKMKVRGFKTWKSIQSRI